VDGMIGVSAAHCQLAKVIIIIQKHENIKRKIKKNHVTWYYYFLLSGKECSWV